MDVDKIHQIMELYSELKAKEQKYRDLLLKLLKSLVYKYLDEEPKKEEVDKVLLWYCREMYDSSSIGQMIEDPTICACMRSLHGEEVSYNKRLGKLRAINKTLREEKNENQ